MNCEDLLDSVAFYAYFISMKRTEVHAAGPLFLERLAPVLTPLFTFLESGSQEAYRFIDSTDAKRINKFLFSDIVRDHVCRKLDELRAASMLGFTRIIKANSGIELGYDGLTIKALRPGVDPEGARVLPAPRSTQQELFYLGNYYVNSNDELMIRNLVVLWTSDHGSRSTSAWLACPKEGRGMYFCEPIPHPASGIALKQSLEEVLDNDDLYQIREVNEAEKANEE